MKLTHHTTERRKRTLNHLSRIEGQLKTLRKYIANNRSCSDIAGLATSIAKSFDTLRVRTLEGFIMNELMDGKHITKAKKDKLTAILNLHKK